MTEGVDYSWARPGGAKLAANGKAFAVRYLWPGGGKGLTVDEVADLRAHGVSIAVVFERDAGRAGEGHAAGVADAQLAQSQLVACGLPANLPIYFAVDFDTSWANVADYFDGVASAIGPYRTGVYGGIRVIRGAQASGSVKWYWQTYAWSGGQRADGIHLYQYSNGEWGGSVDFTRAYSDSYGQAAVASLTPEEDDDLPFSAADLNTIVNNVVTAPDTKTFIKEAVREVLTEAFPSDFLKLPDGSPAPASIHVLVDSTRALAGASADDIAAIKAAVEKNAPAK